MRNIKSWVLCLVIILATFTPLFVSLSAKAETLTSRSVAIGTSLASANTRHTFSFNVPTVNSIGSIAFEYCSNSPLETVACVAPAGLNLNGATLSSQTGETGFVKDPASTVNRIVLSRPAVNTVIGPSSYRFTNVVNQSGSNAVAFVRIATYASVDATGPNTDLGAVAYSTASQLSVTGYVPPYLTFCTGITVVLNCTSASGVYLNFGELSKTQPNVATSQFSTATNDPAGYTTSVFGTTMTSGTNIIPALASPTISSPGVSQFGINLRSNGNPSVGSNASGIGSASAKAPYNSVNKFAFGNGTVASSTKPTDFNKFTVSYLVNVSQSQKPGIYATTLTYVASAAF